MSGPIENSIEGAVPVIKVDEEDLEYGVNLLSVHEISKMFQIPEHLIGAPNSNLPMQQRKVRRGNERP